MTFCTQLFKKRKTKPKLSVLFLNLEIYFILINLTPVREKEKPSEPRTTRSILEVLHSPPPQHVSPLDFEITPWAHELILPHNTHPCPPHCPPLSFLIFHLFVFFLKSELARWV